MLDLLIVFVPYLPPAQSNSLFNATATPAMLEHPDATVQKKSYRLLKRLLEGGKLKVEGKTLEAFVEKLNAVGGGVGPGAQRVGPLFSVFVMGVVRLTNRTDSSYLLPW
jgi:ribosomal RNA-processing protein 12